MSNLQFGTKFSSPNDDIKTVTMVGCWWFEAEISYLWCFYDFPLFLSFSLIFMNMQIR